MSRIIIAGLGYLGLPLARECARRGWEVLGLVRSADSAAAIKNEPFRVTVCDISQREDVARLDAECVEAVIHCASSGRGGAGEYRAVFLDGCRNLMSTLRPARFVFTSSTSVYAQEDGSVVDELSPAEPSRETGRVLRETEDFVTSAGGVAARLAGIYGPGRSVLLRKFFSGEAVIEGDGGRIINQAHREDIISALLQLAGDAPTGIYNVCDDAPMPQRAVYEWLARHFGRPLPPCGPEDRNRKRGWTSKRVSNAKLRALGWVPRWPSFFDAVAGDGQLAGGFPAE